MSGAGAGIDLYSLLALAIFATFLGYVVFYYISVNGGGRSLSSWATTDDLMPILAQVLDGLERWAVLDFISKNNPANEAKSSWKRAFSNQE